MSLVSQMGSSINGKFSYCLSSPSKLSSKINFGGKGMFSSPGVVSTPFLSKASLPYFYVILEGISVGNKRFNVHNSTNISPLSSNFWWSFKGNIATLSYLPTKLYSQLETAMREAIGNSLEETKDPSQFLSLCYKTQPGAIGMPIVTFHFKGADLKLKTFNTFIRVKEDTLCLAFASSDEFFFFFVFGNVAQRKVVSFKPADCTIIEN